MQTDIWLPTYVWSNLPDKTKANHKELQGWGSNWGGAISKEARMRAFSRCTPSQMWPSMTPKALVSSTEVLLREMETAELGLWWKYSLHQNLCEDLQSLVMKLELMKEDFQWIGGLKHGKTPRSLRRCKWLSIEVFIMVSSKAAELFFPAVVLQHVWKSFYSLANLHENCQRN